MSGLDLHRMPHINVEKEFSQTGLAECGRRGLVRNERCRKIKRRKRKAGEKMRNGSCQRKENEEDCCMGTTLSL